MKTLRNAENILEDLTNEDYLAIDNFILVVSKQRSEAEICKKSEMVEDDKSQILKDHI